MKNKLHAWLTTAIMTFALASPAVLTAHEAHAEWPEKPVKVIVPWSPGGITDTIARILGQAWSETFGQQFVIENHPGAAGNIGAELVANASADGYTLLMTNPGAFVTNHLLYKDMSYEPDDLDIVIAVAQFPNALMVNKDVPANSVAEFIDYARAHPGELSGASSGVGSSGHLSLELLKTMADLDIVHVPYQGAAPTRVDLAAGRVQVVVDNIPGYMASFEDGSVRMLGVGTRERLDNFPDVPTIEEAGGLEGFQAIVWYALAAPAGTPADIVEKLNEATNEIMEQEEILERMSALHAIPMGGSQADAQAFIDEETARWKKIIDAAGVKPR